MFKSGGDQDLQDVNYSLISAVREGRLDETRILINSYGLSYYQEWFEGYYLLCDALQNKHAAVAKLLLTSGSRVNSINKMPSNTPLHFAVINGDIEIVKMILDKGANIDAKNLDGKTTLHNAIENKKMKVTELLLKHRADVNAGDNDGTTPLHVAAEIGCLQTVEHLLKYGAFVDCVCTSLRKDGYTPLHFAVEKGNEEAVKLLLNRGADINACTKSNLTPLHIATKTGHEMVVKLLLRHGAKVDSQNKDSKTILHLAVEKGYLTIVKDVLKYCPDIYDKSNRGSLRIAVHGYGEKYKKIIEALLEYGLTINPQDKNYPELLHAAVEKGYLKIIEDLLNYGADVNTLKNVEEGYTPLHSAAKYKQEEVAKLLISYKADLNVQDRTEKTPLFYAIENADLKITKLLLNNGANIKNSLELLIIAVQKECIEMVEALLQYDANINVNATDKYGRTALHYTANESKYLFDKDPDINVRGDIAKLLLSKGANVEAQTKNGETTLYDAIQKGYTKVVEALLEYNANVNSTVKSDITPLHLSAQKGNKEIIIMLLNKGANVNAKQEDGTTALHIATDNGHKEVVKLLLECGAQVDSKAETPLLPHGFRGHRAPRPCACEPPKTKTYELTPLHLSAEGGNKEISIMLLNKGADVNAKQKEGFTALHIATWKGHKEVVKVLLECGAAVDSKSKNGITPLNFATNRGNLEIIETILEFGADINCIADAYGRTALNMASRGVYDKVVVTLLEYGADINITDRHNEIVINRVFSDISKLNRTIGINPGDYLSPHLRIAEALKRHIVKMHTANFYVSEKNLLSLKSNELCDFKNECEKEIANMKSEKIDNFNTSFYDILAKGTSSLTIYNIYYNIYNIYYNENIVQVLKSDGFKIKFPIYARMIECNVRKGMKKKELLEQSFKNYCFLFNKFPELPYICTEKIFSYLSDTDLRILMFACKPLGTCNPN